MTHSALLFQALLLCLPAATSSGASESGSYLKEIKEAVGYFESVKGPVGVVRGRTRIAATRTYRVRAGDEVTLPANATAMLAVHRSGKTYALTAGSFSVEPDRVLILGPRGTPTPARREPKVIRTVDTRLAAQAGMAPSANSQVILGTKVRTLGNGLGAPTPNGALRPGAVMLRWTNQIDANAPPGAGLLVRVRRHGKRTPVLSESLPVAATSFPVPAAILEPGHLHYWQVEGVGGVGIHQVRGAIWMLTPETARDIEGLEALAAALRQDAANVDYVDFLLARVYENAGLYPEALKLYLLLETRQPDSVTAREAVAALRGALGLPGPASGTVPMWRNGSSSAAGPEP